MTNPLPCPLCEGEASMRRYSGDERYGYVGLNEVYCKGCGLMVSRSDGQNEHGWAIGTSGMPEAIAAWNKIAAYPQKLAKLEQELLENVLINISFKKAYELNDPKDWGSQLESSFEQQLVDLLNKKHPS